MQHPLSRTELKVIRVTPETFHSLNKVISQVMLDTALLSMLFPPVMMFVLSLPFGQIVGITYLGIVSETCFPVRPGRICYAFSNKLKKCHGAHVPW